MTDARTERDHALLEAACRDALGRTPSRIDPVPAGLGTRRFHRVCFSDGEPAGLIARLEDDDRGTPTRRDPAAIPAARVPSAPPVPVEPGLEPLRSYLEAHALPVPRSYLHRPEDGLDLLEDLGISALGEARGPDPEPLYAEACALVPRLQALVAAPTEIPAFGRRLDRDLIATKGWKFLHWMIPLLLERDATAAEIKDIERLFGHIADIALAAPQRLAHRDFKAENLHRRDGGQLVMIDLQGAFLAPPEYDLMCLLYDLQVGLDEALVARRFEAVRPTLPDAPSADEARRRFDALAVARLCKDMSHVTHATFVRGDPRRFGEIPDGLELLRRATLRLETEFREIETLNSVIQALTPRALSADSVEREE